MKWLASISGNNVVLDNLDKVYSPHFHAFEESEDHHASSYFLKSKHFDNQTDPKAVMSSMKGLVQLINGAAALSWGLYEYSNKHPITLDTLYYSELSDPGDSHWHIVRSLNNTPPSNPFIGNITPIWHENPYRHQISALIELCIKHEDVFNLLRQMSVGADWRNLYCIWDTITHYCSGPKNTIKELELDNKKIKAFTGTANSFSVLNIEARHGVLGWSTPKHTVDHQEAANIINEVVKIYLRNKFDMQTYYDDWQAQYNPQNFRYHF